MDPSRTPQGHVFYDLIFYCGPQRLRLCLRLFLVLVDQIHQRTVDRLKLCVVFNGLKEFLAVFLHGLEDADLKILGLIVAGACRNEGQIAAAVVLELCKDLKLIFLAVFVGDADEIVAVLLFHGKPPYRLLSCSYSNRKTV